MLTRFTLTLLTLYLLTLSLSSCNKEKQEERAAVLRAVAADVVPTSEKPVPCGANSTYCYPCEFTGAQVCIMSLAWLQGLGKTGSKHYPVLVHPNDHIFWIASTGETKLHVNVAQMDIYDCDQDTRVSSSSFPPVSAPDDANDDQHRITHAVASSDSNVVGRCFKNDVDYLDLLKIKHTLDPHIYIGN